MQWEYPTERQQKAIHIQKFEDRMHSFKIKQLLYFKIVYSPIVMLTLLYLMPIIIERHNFK